MNMLNKTYHTDFSCFRIGNHYRCSYTEITECDVIETDPATSSTLSIESTASTVFTPSTESTLLSALTVLMLIQHSVLLTTTMSTTISDTPETA